MNAATDLIVTDAAIAGVSGHMTWWKANSKTVIERPALAAAWAAAGLPTDWLPEAVTPGQALRSALDSVSTRGQLVRPLGKNAWALVSESKRPLSPGEKIADGDLDYAKQLGCQLDGERLEFSPSWHDKAPAVQVAYETALDALTPQALSAWLAELAYKCSATSLRKMGGVYYVPDGNGGGSWAGIVTVLRDKLEAAAIYTVPVMRTSDAVQGVLDALTNEVDDAIDNVLDGLDDANIRGIRGRTARLATVQAKLAQYADFLGPALEGIRARITQAEGAVAAASVAPMAAELPEAE